MRDGSLTHTHWNNELTVRQVSGGAAGRCINPVQLKLSHRDVVVWGSENTAPLVEGETMDVDEGDADEAFGWRDETVESVGFRSRDLPCGSVPPGCDGLEERKQVSWGHRPRRCVNIHHTLAWQWRTWRQRAKWAGSLGYRWACRIKRIQGPKQQQLQNALTNGGREGPAAAHGQSGVIKCLLLNNVSMKHVISVAPRAEQSLINTCSNHDQWKTNRNLRDTNTPVAQEPGTHQYCRFSV